MKGFLLLLFCLFSISLLYGEESKKYDSSEDGTLTPAEERQESSELKPLQRDLEDPRDRQNQDFDPELDAIDDELRETEGAKD